MIYLFRRSWAFISLNNHLRVGWQINTQQSICLTMSKALGLSPGTRWKHHRQYWWRVMDDGAVLCCLFSPLLFLPLSSLFKIKKEKSWPREVAHLWHGACRGLGFILERSPSITGLENTPPSKERHLPHLWAHSLRLTLVTGMPRTFWRWAHQTLQMAWNPNTIFRASRPCTTSSGDENYIMLLSPVLRGCQSPAKWHGVPRASKPHTDSFAKYSSPGPISLLQVCHFKKAENTFPGVCRNSILRWIFILFLPMQEAIIHPLSLCAWLGIMADLWSYLLREIIKINEPYDTCWMPQEIYGSSCAFLLCCGGCRDVLHKCEWRYGLIVEEEKRLFPCPPTVMEWDSGFTHDCSNTASVCYKCVTGDRWPPDGFTCMWNMDN